MEFFDKIIESFSKKIDYVRKSSMGVPKTFTINLANQILDQPYNLSGNVYYVWSAPNETDFVNIKVNKSSEPPIRCFRQTGLRTPFEKLLITTPAGQTGDMVILYGTESPEMLDIIDNRSATVAGIAGILAELQGDQVPENFIGVTITAAPGATLIMAARAARKGAAIQALSSNGGSVFIGFDNTVTVGGAPGVWFAELQAGTPFTIDDYRGPIYGIATAAQVVGTGEW